MNQATDCFCGWVCIVTLSSDEDPDDSDDDRGAAKVWKDMLSAKKESSGSSLDQRRGRLTSPGGGTVDLPEDKKPDLPAPTIVPSPQLKPKFNIHNIYPERKKKFMAIAKEPCAVRKDPIEGPMLVLKQHYQK